MSRVEHIAKNSPLRKETSYVSHYSPSLLFPIKRVLSRLEMGIPNILPFHGYDVWNAFEVSWLTANGKPEVGVIQLEVPCESPAIFESKSLKLYLFSFNNTHFSSKEELLNTIKRDLLECTGSEVRVSLISLENYPYPLGSFPGTCLDDLDIECDFSNLNPDYLSLETSNKTEMVEEKLYSHLFRSNCLITLQPDWATAYIHYQGPKISHEGLLKYFISFRNHNEFHEPCTEKIFMDITQRCAPQKLTVNLRFTRRGGIDINPFRSNWPSAKAEPLRLVRQ